MNGFTLLALIMLGLGIVVAYRAGAMRERRAQRDDEPLRPLARPATPSPLAAPAPHPPSAAPAPAPAVPTPSAAPPVSDALAGERFRAMLAFEDDAARCGRELARRDAEIAQLRAFAEERRALFAALAGARAETARYRQVLIDLENDAPPPLLDGPGAPDDLKLIVGVGPVLERMLQQLGIMTYRQIARWSERDIDEFDARLPEFHGRIRRDAWVTQARALHQSKYGEPAVPHRG